MSNPSPGNVFLRHLPTTGLGEMPSEAYVAFYSIPQQNSNATPIFLKSRFPAVALPMSWDDDVCYKAYKAKMAARLPEELITLCNRYTRHSKKNAGVYSYVRNI